MRISGEPVILKNARFLILPDGDGFKVLEGVDVVIEDSRITSIGRAVDAPRGAYRIDCSSMLLMPGLVNAHTHAAMVCLRGYCDDAELPVWLSRVQAPESKLTPDVVYYASVLACLEMITTGTCGFVDMYFYPEETVKAAKLFGLHVAVGPIVGGSTRKLPELREWRSRIEGLYDRAKLVLNVHSVYKPSPEVLVDAFSRAREENVPVHIHVSETRWEIMETKRRLGVFPVEYLESKGCLEGCDVVMVHLNWVTSWELDIMARRNVKAVVCPSSGMKLANAGFTPVLEMLEKKIPVALGTDGACSANRLSVFDEMRQLVLLYRHNYWNTRITAYHALKVAMNGYEVLGIEPPRIGAPANIIGVDLRKPWLIPQLTSNAISLAVYSAYGADVALNVVNGDIAWFAGDETFREEAEKLVDEASRRVTEFFASVIDDQAVLERPR